MCTELRDSDRMETVTLFFLLRASMAPTVTELPYGICLGRMFDVSAADIGWRLLFHFPSLNPELAWGGNTARLTNRTLRIKHALTQ